MRFNYNLPVNILFGTGRIEEIGEQTAHFGKNALLVIGKSSARKSGLYDKVIASLNASNVKVTVFDDIEANPLTTTAQRGGETAKKNMCDIVLGVGGGSVLDAAKAIAFCGVNEGDISDYIFGRKTSSKALPIILAPTTCGTGSEGNSFSVLTNPETKDKKALKCPHIIPKVSIIDPGLMTTMPKTTLASVGFDALCHCVEAYISRNAQPLTDIMALEGMKIAAESLPKLFEDAGDIWDWEKLTWASTLGGMVINTAGVAAPHAMEHPVSGLTDAAHGQGLAALIPAVLEETLQAADANTLARLSSVSKILGGESERDCSEMFRQFSKKIGLDCNLTGFGVTEGEINWLGENCVKVSPAGLACHPVQFSIEQINKIYKISM